MLVFPLALPLGRTKCILPTMNRQSDSSFAHSVYTCYVFYPCFIVIQYNTYHIVDLWSMFFEWMDNEGLNKLMLLFTFSFLKDFIYLFSEKGREKEGERDISVWLSLVHPQLGTWPTTDACVLTGNQTSDPVVRRPVFNPLSHTSQGILFLIPPYNTWRLGKWMSKLIFHQNFMASYHLKARILLNMVSLPPGT